MEIFVDLAGMISGFCIRLFAKNAISTKCFGWRMKNFTGLSRPDLKFSEASQHLINSI